MKLKHWHTIFIGCLFLFLFTACSKKQATENPETFQVTKPLIKDTIQQHEYVAEINAVQYVEVRSRVKGYIEKIHVDEGQSVKQNQLLFSISNKKFEQELLKAEAILKSTVAELKTAEVELTNVKALAEKKIVSTAELEMSQARVDAMKARVEEAKALRGEASANLTFANVRAPFEGIINRIPNKTGSLVEEGTMLTTISDNREVFAYFNLSENDYLEYHSNGNRTDDMATVSLLLTNNTLYQHEGKVETIESEFNPATGNIAFRARFPNPDQILKHGASGKIIVRKELNETLMIPQQSTFEIQDKVYVFVVTRDSTLEQRNIIPKMRIPHYYLVESGLSHDEKILFEGVQSVRDGDKIVPEWVSAEETTIAETAH